MSPFRRRARDADEAVRKKAKEGNSLTLEESSDAVVVREIIIIAPVQRVFRRSTTRLSAK